MTDTNNYIETDKEREEGHVDTGKENLNVKIKAPIWDVIWGSMLPVNICPQVDDYCRSLCCLLRVLNLIFFRKRFRETMTCSFSPSANFSTSS